MAKKRRLRKVAKEEQSSASPLDTGNYDELISRIKPVASLDEPLKVLFYGRSGTGKTTIASTFPKKIILVDVQEKGTDSIIDVEGVDVLQVQNFNDLEMIPWMIKSGAADYQTVVIDAISAAQTMLVDELLEETGKDQMTKQLWGHVSGRFQSLILGLRNLQAHVVFIAHDRTRSNDDEEGDVIEPEVGPSLIPSVAKTLTGAVGIIGQTYIAEKVVQKGAKVKRSLEYRVRLGPHPYYTTKVRNPKKFKAPAYIVNGSFEKLKAVVEGKYGKEE